MKSILLLLVGLISIGAIAASSLAKPLHDSEPTSEIKWLDFEAAIDANEADRKPIFIDIYTSWCGWCKKLRAEVFSRPEFKKWAEENVVLLELDFPRRKKLPEEQVQQNRGLQQAFQVRGYPTIWVFDLKRPNENERFEIHALGKTGYIRGGASVFTGEIDKMIERKLAAN